MPPDNHVMTQEELADLSGVDRRHIGKIETGIIEEPEYSVIKRLADALKISVRDLGEPLHWWDQEPLPAGAFEAAERAIVGERSLSDERKQAALIILRDLFAHRERRAG